MTTKPERAPEPSTPGRPHETSRQQKHDDQHLQTGSDELDHDSKHDASREAPTPPGAK